MGQMAFIQNSNLRVNSRCTKPESVLPAAVIGVSARYEARRRLRQGTRTVIVTGRRLRHNGLATEVHDRSHEKVEDNGSARRSKDERTRIGGTASNVGNDRANYLSCFSEEALRISEIEALSSASATAS